jgi:2-keto-4-pentenoate hydratase
MPPIDIAQAVEEFWRSQQKGVYFPPQWVDRLTLHQAYQVQLGLMDRRIAEGANQIGWKVGLTSEPIQKQFHVHEPVFGYLMDTAPHDDGTCFVFDDLIVPGVENELCVTMGTDLPGPGVTPEQALEAAASVRPALEIVERRGNLTRHLALAMADNGQQKAVVLGQETPLHPGDLDLASVTVKVLVNGEQVAEGMGKDVLGHPMRSVAWLANKLSEFDRHLRAGDLIMSGSFTQQFSMNKGDSVTAGFDPLGSVSASFT